MNSKNKSLPIKSSQDVNDKMIEAWNAFENSFGRSPEKLFLTKEEIRQILKDNSLLCSWIVEILRDRKAKKEFCGMRIVFWADNFRFE